MIEFLIGLVVALLYGYCDALGHSWTGKTLACMKYRNGKEVDGKFAKGKFHTWFMLARVSVWLGLSGFSYFYLPTWWLASLIYGFVIMILHSVVHYDGISFKINVSCEKWGTGLDTDCITIWLRDKFKINIWITEAVLLVGMIVWYLI